MADSEIVQCQRDSECEELIGAGATCRDEVCFASNEPGGEDSDGGTGSAEPDGATADDASSRLPERWACIADRQMPVPQRGRTVEVRFTVVNFAGFEVPAEVSAKACVATDVMCSDPVVDNVTPDETGFLNFVLPHGFAGYFEISSPEILVSLLYSNRPYFQDVEFEAPAVVSPALSMALAAGGGEEIDESLGIAIIDVFDCNGDAGPGVQFSQEGGASDETPFYFEGALPDRDRSSTTTTTQASRDMTPRAFGGFSMAEVGYLTLIGTLEETGHEVARVTVSIRPEVMTFAMMFAGY